MNSSKEVRKDLNRVDQNKVVQRRRVSDNDPHLTPKAEAAQSGPFALQISLCEVQPNLMLFQESVQFIARFESQQLADLHFC